MSRRLGFHVVDGMMVIIAQRALVLYPWAMICTIHSHSHLQDLVSVGLYNVRYDREGVASMEIIVMLTLLSDVSGASR